LLEVELCTHAAQDRELDTLRNNIMQLLLKLERPIYINKRNRQDRLDNTYYSPALHLHRK
jgi:hypothetical protein